MTFLGAVLLLLTIVLYVGWIATLITRNSSDPAGNALSQSYAVLIAIGVWLGLAGLSLIAGLRGQMPGSAAVAAVILVPASGAAAIAAVQLLSDRVYTSSWPLVIPVVAPLLIIGFAVWAYLPAFHRAIPAGTASFVAWGGIALLSITPWPAVAYRARHREVDQAEAQTAWIADEPRRLAEEKEQNLAAFRRLTPESELSEWLAFRLPDNELRQQALQGIRRLPRRQADAELMMRRGLDYFWQDVPELDLAATPVICDRARVFLREKAQDIRPLHPEDPPRFANMVERVQPYLPTMKWLVDHRCECDAELAAIEATAQLYPDSPERNQFLAELARIRQPR